MRQEATRKLWHDSSANRFLLCALVSKETRRLIRAMPRKRVSECITLALVECAGHELQFQVPDGAPDVVRDGASHLRQVLETPTINLNATLATGPPDNKIEAITEALPEPVQQQEVLHP